MTVHHLEDLADEEAERTSVQLEWTAGRPHQARQLKRAIGMGEWDQ
jgi:hypothetical protein